MSWWSINLPSSVLAFVTTAHAVLAVVRQHRSATAPHLRLLLLPSAALTLSPWFLSTLGGLGAGLALHFAWFLACERLAAAGGAADRSRSSGRTAESVARSPKRVLRPKEFVPVTVLAVHDETDTIRTFRMSRPEDFSFVAGQFLTVRVAVDGQAYVRCYSVSSAPEAIDYLEISVRRQGTVSTALHAACTPGSVLLAKPPAGRFTYPSGDPRPLVLLAGGVGITPLVSMLRHAVAREPWRRVTLIYSVRTERDVAFRDELARIAERHPQVSIVVTSSHAEPGATGRTGRIDEPLIREHVGSPADSLFYICGPVPMIESMRAMLLELGVRGTQVRSEEFQPTVAIGARATAPTAGGAASGEPPGVVAKLLLTVSNRSADVPRGATLLEAAEAAGVVIPSLCRSGVCGTCKTRLVSGAVQCSSDALDADERANQYTLPCVAWPVGDCALEA